MSASPSGRSTHLICFKMISSDTLFVYILLCIFQVQLCKSDLNIVSVNLVKQTQHKLGACCIGFVLFT